MEGPPRGRRTAGTRAPSLWAVRQVVASKGSAVAPVKPPALRDGKPAERQEGPAAERRLPGLVPPGPELLAEELLKTKLSSMLGRARDGPKDVRDQSFPLRSHFEATLVTRWEGPRAREPLERTEVTPVKSPAVARRPALRPERPRGQRARGAGVARRGTPRGHAGQGRPEGRGREATSLRIGASRCGVALRPHWSTA